MSTDKRIKSFKMGARTYRVKYVAHDRETLGIARTPIGTIEIQTVWDGKPVPADAQAETLWHEVVHCVLDQIGRTDLNSDESLVQSVAAMMYQFSRTAR